eukprot:TRINITY_DN5893_c0_g1_i2.p1 TRINITY_DN5893_c0_g1~~TRINITY_DN5893_c0_g1_i2.p1  ORF type:complete len:179 (-),score=26.90 TRINITY_DN5893_c0_g1_i2:105-641(-)
MLVVDGDGGGSVTGEVCAPSPITIGGYLMCQPSRRGLTNNMGDTSCISTVLGSWATIAGPTTPTPTTPTSTSTSATATQQHSQHAQSPTTPPLLPHTFSEDDCYYIHELTVNPSHQGRGYSAPLVAYAEQHARLLGYKCMSLVALPSALEFWRRHSFAVAREFDYYGNVCYYMEKTIH